MKIKKKLTYIGLFIIIGLGVVYYMFFKGDSATTSEKILTTKVKIGSIQNSIKTTGTANLIDEQEMKFNMDGEVVEVFFKAGDKVKKGDIIAQLDNSDALVSVQQAQISLDNAKIEMSQKLKAPENTELMSLQNSLLSVGNNVKVLNEQLQNLISENTNTLKDKNIEVQSLESDINILQLEKENKIKEYDSQIISKENDINSKTQSLKILEQELETIMKQQDKTLNDLDISNNSTIKNAYDDGKKYLIDADNYLTTIDNIYGISDSNKYKTVEYDIYLSGKDPSTKTKVISNFANANQSLIVANEYYSSLSTENANSESVIKLFNHLKILYNNLISLGQYSTDGLKNSVPSAELSQSSIDSYYNSANSILNSSKNIYDNIKSTIENIEKLTDKELQQLTYDTNINQKKLTISDAEANLSSLESELSNIKNNKRLYLDNINNSIQQKQLSLESKSEAIQLLKKSFELSIKEKQNNIQEQQKNEELTNEKLSDLIAGPDAQEIQILQNNIEKLQLQLQQSQKNLDKYEIQAPFDGIVRKIDFKVGDKIVSTDNKYVYLENPNLVEITSTIDQIDIVNVKLGQKVDITFDSYKNQTFQGVVSEIDSTPISSSGVTSYSIKISLDKGKQNIYSGMSAVLSIIIESKENVLIVPNSFIVTQKKNSFVNKGGELIKVTTGIKDSSNIEIVQGLDEGDEITRKVTVSSSANTTNTSSNTTRTMRNASGMGGGPGGFR